jgi:hypothetical protein
LASFAPNTRQEPRLGLSSSASRSVNTQRAIEGISVREYMSTWRRVRS